MDKLDGRDEIMNPLRLDIDPLALDQEWLGQANLLHTWAVAAANADAAEDNAKAALKVIEAELELEIRTSPASYNLEKATEGAIKAAMVATPLHKQATKKYNEARHAASICHAAVAAIDTRKRALEKLVDLLRLDYYADPRAPQGREAVSDTEKRSIRGRGIRDRNGDEE